MAKVKVAPKSLTSQGVSPLAARAFFEEALGDSVADATEILDGLQRLIWAMDEQADAADNTPAYMIELWRDHLEILRARVRCLSESKGVLTSPEAVA